MLYWLLYQKLFPYFRPFRIFRYLTFRTAFATLTALLIALFIGPYVIERLREFQIGQYIREDGPQVAPEKGRHADDGRRADLHRDSGADAAVVRPVESVCVDGDVFDAGVWGDRVCGRLHQGGAAAEPGADGARQSCSGRGWSGSSLPWSLVVLEQFKLFSTRLMVPFVKSFRPDLVWHPGRATLPHLALLAFLPFVIFVMLWLVRLDERGEPDRRAGWAGDRLHDYRRRRADGADLCERARGVCRLS